MFSGVPNARTYDTPPSCPSTPGTQAYASNAQTKRAPMFITVRLKDTFQSLIVHCGFYSHFEILL